MSAELLSIDDLLRRYGMSQQQQAAPQVAPQMNTSVLDSLSARNAQDPRSVAGGINDMAQPLLQRLGIVGRGISKGVDALEGVGDHFRGAAERGVLGGIAPRFQAGVNAAQERAMQEMSVKAQMLGAMGGGESKPLTEAAKLAADYQAGRISPEIYEAKMGELFDVEVNNRFNRTQSLRGEFSKETQDIQKSLSALSAARRLANTSNPTAQLASFISTIRSIDNSTVREGELRAFEQVRSLADRLEQFQKSLVDGGFSETLMKDIQETITALESPLTELLGKKQQFYRDEAGKFRLDPNSVAGLPFSTVEGQTLMPAPRPPQGNPAAVGDDEKPVGEI